MPIYTSDRCDGRMQPIKVLISLSNQLLCRGLQGLLVDESGAYCARIATGAEEFTGFDPDEILVDSHTLIPAYQQRWPQAKVILIDTGLTDEELIYLLLNHKIDGVISTSTDEYLFRKALQAILNGEIWIDNGKLKVLMNSLMRYSSNRTKESLSKKERDIVLCIAEGLKNKKIAERLNISEQTVKTHIGRIFRKANVSSRSQLVPLALTMKPPFSH
ncbi:response regulator transcription factor [Geomonas sp.]|uniref:response regulator transcription factor n=1 Tax=Geomonas sp. TaxID=2651584 RepID=UPI002B49C961|nr:response regulator transcription factor [Geomonas sp.]HJV33625.1 response regulator transcription factor [Geomonas sp.]